MRIYTSLVGAIALAGLTFIAPVVGSAFAQPDIQLRFRFGTREHPLEGHRYQTMRALAHYLDERADDAAHRAADSTRYGRRERRFLDAIHHFAADAHAFHERMDGYVDSPWEVPGHVEHLVSDAHRVSDDLRSARVYEETWDDWDAVLDVLDRMERVLEGEDVRVPPAHRRDRDDDRDYQR